MAEAMITPEASWCSSAEGFSGADLGSFASDAGDPPLSTVGGASTVDTVSTGALRVGHCLQVPEEGALVCLLTSRSAPLMATFNRRTKAWDLFPTVHKQDGSVLYLPNECLFIVVRQGERMGLRCVAADGRLVQCTRHAADPLRAANYNFGKWETWEPAEGGGFRNRAWGRLLDVEIHEVRSCLASALYENELSHRREENLLRDALEEAQEARQETEDTLERVVAESGVHITAARSEVARFEGELERSLSESANLMARLAQSDSQKVKLERSLSQAAQDGQDLKACLEAARGEGARLSSELSATVQASAEKVRHLVQARADEQRALEAKHAEEVAELEFELEKREEALQVIASRASLFSTPRSSASTVTKRAFVDPAVEEGIEPAAKALDMEESPESQYADADSDVQQAAAVAEFAADDKENVPPSAFVKSEQAFELEGEQEFETVALEGALDDETAHLVQLSMPDEMGLQQFSAYAAGQSSEEEDLEDLEGAEGPATGDYVSPGRRSVTEMRALYENRFEGQAGSPVLQQASTRSPVAPSSHDLGLKTAEYFEEEAAVEARAAAKAKALDDSEPAGLANISRAKTSMRMGARIGAPPPNIFA